ncbi:fatty acid alpha-hydroxylase [Blyttiomyces sp. JEL0837]|nr:fatty acid alpha-hydroxylase [Blyttiomyces sp. JEL0837]
MQESSTHEHSDSAYDMLEEYCIGSLALDEGVEMKATESNDGETAKDKKKVAYGFGQKKPFIDVEKPMLAQVFFGKFTKQFYLEQVHIPRQVKGSAPIFGPAYLEIFTKTPWFVIPMVYIPIVSYLLSYSLQVNSALSVGFHFAVGVFCWTLIEYSLHRFLFHIDDYLPDNRVAITLHFLLHGIHHFLPMDRQRLVMPPVLGLTLSSFFVVLFRAIFPTYMYYGVMAGAFFGFQGYDMIHYYLHHGRPAFEHLREMKTYHLDHHYKNANLGYGITSKLWDYVFGTLL